MMLERQNKELKVKLEEVENSNRAKAKAAIGEKRKRFGVSKIMHNAMHESQLFWMS